MLRKTRLRRWQLLADMVRANKWRIGAELGVFKGATFLHLLAVCPELSLVGVDLWKPMPEKDSEIGGRSYSGHDLDAYYERVKLRSTTYGNRACLLRMSTLEASMKFPDHHFDFVWIDADHTYEGVKSDIKAWKPKVRPGGWMIGHDYNPEDFPGVIQAVKEAFGKPDLHPCHVWSVPLPD